MHIYQYVWYDNSNYIFKYINKNKTLANSNIVIDNFKNYSIIPYFKNTSIKVYNYCSGDIANYDTTVFPRSKYCYFDKVFNEYKQIYDYNQINKIFDDSRNNILIESKDLSYKLICSDNEKECFGLRPIKQIGKDDSKDDKIYLIERYNNSNL